jgi:hypothetical protein
MFSQFVLFLRTIYAQAMQAHFREPGLQRGISLYRQEISVFAKKRHFVVIEVAQQSVLPSASIESGPLLAIHN